MFKGLRTKIESEQKGQTKSREGSSSQAAIKSDNLSKETGTQLNAKLSPSKANISKDNEHEKRTDGTISHTSTIFDKCSNLQFSQGIPDSRQSHQIVSEESHETEEDLESQIIKLRDQISKLTRERDESNDQNAQLYQIIEKLRRNLENQKETNSNLQARLHEVENELKEQAHKPDVSKKGIQSSSKSLNLDKLASTQLSTTDDVDTLKHGILELQAQLSMKNRQLKVRQQNLNDLKRTLQKEMLSHNKTQDELKKLQNQLRDQEKCSSFNEKDSSLIQQNGSNKNETGDNNTKKDSVSKTSSENNQDLAQTASTSLVIGGSSEDNISLGPAGSGLAQLDRISYQSRSTASVDDFEPNDLQQNSFNREVSHEYLKNILYRYMTSTETETMRHLIKAISVIMDFSPEQSAAIKSAMNSRTSWLRLK